MAGRGPTFGAIVPGPRTFEAKTQVAGGQLVELGSGASPSGLPFIQPASANSVTCFGVAFKDAVPASAQAAMEQSTTADGGFPVTSLAIADEFTVVYNDCFIVVNFAIAVVERAPLKVAANGTVTLWVDGTDAVSRRIGWNAQPGGVGAAGPGLARILI